MRATRVSLFKMSRPTEETCLNQCACAMDSRRQVKDGFGETPHGFTRDYLTDELAVCLHRLNLPTWANI